MFARSKRHISKFKLIFLPVTGRMQLSVRAASAVVEAKPKTDLILIPGGKGKATHMKKGDLLKVINTHGKQVSSA